MRKVIIGFKGDPQLKLEVSQEARSMEMSVSEYLETIVENLNNDENAKTLFYKVQELQEEQDRLQDQLNEYEQALEEHFEAFGYSELPYRQANGEIEAQFVSTKLEMLKCFLSSIKTEQ